MKPEEAREKAATWKGGNWANRLDECRMLLHIHGFLTESESDRVNAKILKWAAKGGVTRAQPNEDRP